ncbi:hypothetical protein BMEGG_05835 [Priestia megaterium]
MTGNLSRTVLRGAGARESARLPDLTRSVYHIQPKKKKTTLSELHPNC